MDFLAQSSMSQDHITVVRSLCIVHNGDTSPFSDQRISLFVKFLKLTRTFTHKFPILTEETYCCKL